MAGTPLQVTSEAITALWSRWYGLPARSTRARIEPLRQAAAASLLGTGDVSAIVGPLLAALLKLPDVAGALEEARPGLAREAAQVAGQNGAGGRLSLEGARSEATRGGETATEREALAALLAAEDPFAAALARLHDQPGALPAALEAVAVLVHTPSALDDATKAQAVAILEHTAAAQRAAANDNAARVLVQSQALRELQAIRPLRILAWRSLLAARVLTPAQVTTKLSGGADARLAPPAEPAAPLITPEAPPAAAPAAPSADAAPHYTDIYFPASLPRSRTLWEPLIVRLTTTPQAPAGAAAATPVALDFAAAGQPEQLEVRVTAPDFEERFGAWTRTLPVWAGRDSEPVVFLVRATAAGAKRISVDFAHRGRIVASVALQTNVIEGEARPGSGRAALLGEASPLDALAEDPPPSADLELRVVLADARRLLFTLHSAHADVGYHWKAAGEVTLQADPATLFEEKFARLSEAAADEAPTPESAARVQAELAALGEELWDELLPESFKGALWPEIRRLQETGRVRSLLITSDEPWIPWEMVKPYTRNEVTGNESSEPFWAEQFALARWLAGRGSAARVNVAAARIVAPELDLAYVAEERRSFDGLAAHGIQLQAPLQTRAELQALLRDGGVQLLHLAAHGTFDPAAPNRSRFKLADGSLTPDDLSPSATRGLRAARPLVLMNACSVGRLALTPTGLGGWADKWVQTGRVGAFIGTLWEVNDRLAAVFADTLYSRLFAGDNLGEAVRAARLALRDLEPGNPTWLAYTLYGDPQCVVRPAAGAQQSITA